MFKKICTVCKKKKVRNAFTSKDSSTCYQCRIDALIESGERCGRDHWGYMHDWVVTINMPGDDKRRLCKNCGRAEFLKRKEEWEKIGAY